LTTACPGGTTSQTVPLSIGWFTPSAFHAAGSAFVDIPFDVPLDATFERRPAVAGAVLLRWTSLPLGAAPRLPAPNLPIPVVPQTDYVSLAA